MSDRAMKKWNAYKSLPEHGDSLEGEFKERFKVEKPVISSEEAELINEILVNYHGEELHLTYYRKGELFEVNVTLKKIDPYNKKIVTMEGDKYLFSEIVGLTRIK